MIEGIEEGVEILLNAKGIYTFKKLIETDSKKIKDWLNEQPWGRMMNPSTWPKQAELADIARASGEEKDEDVFNAYEAFLKGGRSG